MRKSRDTYLILTCSCMFMFSIAGSRPLIPLYSGDLGASYAQIGIIIAFFPILPLFLSIKTGKIIGSSGIKTPVFLSFFFGGISLMVPSAINNVTGIYFSQVIAGLAQMIFVISIQTYISRFSEKIREYYVSVFSIGVAVGSFFGPLSGGLLSDKLGYTMTLCTLGSILTISIPVVFFFRDGKNSKKDTKKLRGDKNKSFNLLVIPELRNAFLISVIILFAKDTYIAFFPLLAENKGFSATVIGLIISLNAGSGVLIRMMLPFIIEKFNKGTITIISILFTGLVFLINPLFNDVYMLSFLSIILGLSLGIGQPLSIISTINSLPKQRVGEGLGLRLSVNRLTQAITPVTLGAVSVSIGMSGVFYAAGLLIIAGSTNPRKITNIIRNIIFNR